jgi:hypothetical protein
MTNENLIRIFSGSEVAALLLKAELEEAGVGVILHNDFQSGLAAGFVAGIPDVVDLYISETELHLAQPVIDTFLTGDSI